MFIVIYKLNDVIKQIDHYMTHVQHIYGNALKIKIQLLSGVSNFLEQSHVINIVII